MRPLQDKGRKKIREVIIYLLLQGGALKFPHDLASRSGFATATNHRSLDSRFTSSWQITHLQLRSTVVTLNTPTGGSRVRRPHKHCASQHGSWLGVSNASVSKHKATYYVVKSLSKQTVKCINYPRNCDWINSSGLAAISKNFLVCFIVCYCTLISFLRR
jgi:hypothetical protein